jgi:hypothetical protein
MFLPFRGTTRKRRRRYGVSVKPYNKNVGR